MDDEQLPSVKLSLWADFLLPWLIAAPFAIVGGIVGLLVYVPVVLIADLLLMGSTGPSGDFIATLWGLVLLGAFVIGGGAFAVNKAEPWIGRIEYRLAERRHNRKRSSEK